MSSQWGSYSNGGQVGSGQQGQMDALAHERGSRRRKLAAMAGSVYRAGVAAASELKEQYNNTRIRGVEGPDSQISIPGSFPNVAIVTKGDEQMVLFPSYAKRHIKQFGADRRPSNTSQVGSTAQASFNDEEYWRQEWARMEDEKAIVDVDVRGWIYTPHKGPITRRNRILIGLARRLSGIPAPTVQQGDPTMSSMHEEHERMREEQKIAREAQEIERKGQGEKEVANRGGYSEPPKEDDSEIDSDAFSKSHSGSRTPISAPSSPTLTARPSFGQPSELTEAELAVANANLMARLHPFMTTPLVQLPITIFFYNDEQSQSRTVVTNDAGHFNIRAALDFVPTHVRVLANEDISATEPVNIIETAGISLISDIDDTIKRSSIAMGAREIFRNTFIRDLADLTVEGVKEWYCALHNMGVQIHYCSNSPWQLFPVLATFFYTAGLPPGSIHLKQYSGMLQGIFEPVAERKKGTLDRILRDFPERKFLLVGDSGEADLEVYTELAIANPGRILAVFIRDVTTPEQIGYFESAVGSNPVRRGKQHSGSRIKFDAPDKSPDSPATRPILPPRGVTAPPKPEGPTMGTLIDFSDEPEQMSISESRNLAAIKSNPSALDLLAQKQAPPRPAKPIALRGGPADAAAGAKAGAATHPLAQMQNLSDQTLGSTTSLQKTANGAGAPQTKSPSATSYSSSNSANSSKPPPPPPRRRGTPSSLLSLSPRLLANRRTNSNSDIDFEALPPSAGMPSPPLGPLASGATTPTGGGTSSPVNKKVDLWRRRLARAHEMLEQHGVRLYTWRRGDDVVVEASGIVREALAELARDDVGRAATAHRK